MKHEFLDHHSYGHSFFHRMHPGAKLSMTVIFIFSLVTIGPGQEWAFLFYAVLLAAALISTGVPIRHITAKGLKVIPFLLVITIFIPFFKPGAPRWRFSIGPLPVIITEEGFRLFLNIFLKGTLAIYSTVFLNLTTPFHRLLKGLQSFGAPRIVTDALSVAYRYLFVITDEKERMLMARRSRLIYPSLSLQWKSLSQLAGVLFLRSYERGERMYQAMCARGFDGTIVELDDQPLAARDVVVAALVALAAMAFRIWLIEL
ncbi:MAG: cobalt ECF transporter T component CbiQ [Candidatus Omnitrophota bacterium]